MRTTEVRLLGSVSVMNVERAIGEVCEELGLRVGIRSTLAGHRDSLHWHLKREKERGTLEVSFVPEPTRLWLAVHKNREGAWIDDAVARFAVLLQDALTQPS